MAPAVVKRETLAPTGTPRERTDTTLLRFVVTLPDLTMPREFKPLDPADAELLRLVSTHSGPSLNRAAALLGRAELFHDPTPTLERTALAIEVVDPASGVRAELSFSMASGIFAHLRSTSIHDFVLAASSELAEGCGVPENSIEHVKQDLRVLAVILRYSDVSVDQSLLDALAPR